MCEMFHTDANLSLVIAMKRTRLVRTEFRFWAPLGPNVVASARPLLGVRRKGSAHQTAADDPKPTLRRWCRRRGAGSKNKFVEHVVLAVRRSTGCRRSHFGCGWSSHVTD